MSRNKKWTVLLALVMLVLANMACGGGGTDKPTPTAETPEGAEAEAPVKIEVEVEAETEAQAEAYITVKDASGNSVEFSTSNLGQRKDCFACLPKGEDSPSELPAGCTWGLVTEYYAQGYATQDSMQKTGLPAGYH